MTIHEELARTVHGAPAPDFHAMAAGARADGTRLRRRRTASVAVLGAAATVVLAVGGVAAAGLTAPEGPAPERTVVATAPDERPAYEAGIPGGDRVDPTSRGTAAALAWSVHEEDGDAELSQFRGQIGAPYDPPGAGEPGARDVHASLHLDTGRGPAQVQVTVTYDAGLPDCQDPTIHTCTRGQDGGGGRTVHYTTRTENGDGVRVQEVAMYLRANGTRVSVSASNGYDGPDGFVQTSDLPPLDADDLWGIARRGAVWGRTMPVSYVEAGESLPGYREIDTTF